MTSSEFAQSTLSLGVVHLGRRRQRLHAVWLAAKGHDSISRRTGDDRRVIFNRQRDAHVAGQPRHHAHRLVAVETGILKRDKAPPVAFF